jgi:hypothetical protein
MFLLVLFGLTTSGCGKAPAVDAGEYSSYVDRFVEESRRSGQPVEVQDLKVVSSDAIDPSENAVCDLVAGRTPTVSVNAARWAGLTELERESVLFHELGHCVLKRVHDRTRGTDGEPQSLMYPVRVDSDVYRVHRDEYLRELFGRRGELNP